MIYIYIPPVILNFIYRDELSGRPRGIIVATLYNLTKRDEALITSSLIGVLFV